MGALSIIGGTTRMSSVEHPLDDTWCESGTLEKGIGLHGTATMDGHLARAAESTDSPDGN